MSNNFLVFNENDGNSMTQVDYLANSIRLNGIVPGLAAKEIYNKAFRQSSLMAATFGEIISDFGLNANDDSVTNLKIVLEQVVSTKNKILTPVADITALKAINTTLLDDNVLVICRTLGLFRFDAASTSTPDDVNIIQPDTGSGRWLNLLASSISMDVGIISSSGWVANTGDYAFKLNIALSGISIDNTVLIAPDKDALDILSTARMAPVNDSYTSGVTVYAQVAPATSVAFGYVILK